MSGRGEEWPVTGASIQVCHEKYFGSLAAGTECVFRVGSWLCGDHVLFGGPGGDVRGRGQLSLDRSEAGDGDENHVQHVLAAIAGGDPHDYDALAGRRETGGDAGDADDGPGDGLSSGVCQISRSSGALRADVGPDRPLRGRAPVLCRAVIGARSRAHCERLHRRAGHWTISDRHRIADFGADEESGRRRIDVVCGGFHSADRHELAVLLVSRRPGQQGGAIPVGV